MVKKVVIFGATGMTGLCAVEAAVKKGLEVRAFVRTLSKLPANLKDKVEIFQGNVLEPDSVHDAVEDMDAVVIALGTNNQLEPTSDLSEGTKNIIEAMRAKGVKILSVCLSAFLFYEPDKVPPRFVDLNEDHKRMYQAVKDSGLDYVAVFPPHIADEPSREIIVEVNPEKSPGRAISKYDLGAFLVNSLSEPKYYKSVIGITNAPKA
ncbi:flavin reductase (NADPH) [Leguminivora glycinivorella]|uniref:flavin reductase (NADPH) n=1 Tax=Leguminivora glycinivorella TaxID=1035111 RepID=UPI002010A7EA|nr:flavin reductase (NADPH) [Leguminivora glycinivorella]XP_047994250.1 flavin reductase (NADPH) [Leguminivora glycinivorella]